MTGNEYRDLIGGYIHRAYGQFGLVVYLEVPLGKTIIGKNRKVDVFVVRSSDQRAIALECKYQEVQGTTDEKIPYALEDLGALWVPGCLVYAGAGWSPGIQHMLEASRLAAYCLPDADLAMQGPQTRELDHVLAATFGLWELVLPAARRFAPS